MKTVEEITAKAIAENIPKITDSLAESMKKEVWDWAKQESKPLQEIEKIALQNLNQSVDKMNPYGAIIVNPDNDNEAFYRIYWRDSGLVAYYMITNLEEVRKESPSDLKREIRNGVYAYYYSKNS